MEIHRWLALACAPSCVDVRLNKGKWNGLNCGDRVRISINNTSSTRENNNAALSSAWVQGLINSVKPRLFRVVGIERWESFAEMLEEDPTSTLGDLINYETIFGKDQISGCEILKLHLVAIPTSPDAAATFLARVRM